MAVHVCRQSTVAAYVCLGINGSHKCMLGINGGCTCVSSMVVANINYVLSTLV